MSQNQTTQSHRIVYYIKEHQVSLGLLLAAYGAFYLAVVIMSGWTPNEWSKDIPDLPQNVISPLLPRNFINLFFFITSFPALLIGATILCKYSLKELNSKIVNDGEHVAFILVAFGFLYVVVGAWPLGNLHAFPWEWQKQIMSYGLLFAWFLYLTSVIVLAVGGFSLYVHSRKYHQKHLNTSDFSINTEY